MNIKGKIIVLSIIFVHLSILSKPASYIDQSGQTYALRKTRLYRYKHPEQKRYYASAWWQMPNGELPTPCMTMQPVRYFRNGWPYYWFY